MAKQNPATDPVSAAMSAIESALNLTDDDEAILASDTNATSPQLFPAKATTATPVLKPSPLAGDAPTLLRAGPSVGVADNEPKPAISAATPANDDRENVGAVLQAMNARPASRDSVHTRPDCLAPVGGDLCALRLCRSFALGLEETRRAAAAARDPIIFVGGAGANHLHVRLCRAVATAARVATIGARDLPSRGASGRARDNGGRPCGEPVPGHPSRAHVDGGWRRTRACARRGARDPRAI